MDAVEFLLERASLKHSGPVAWRVGLHLADQSAQSNKCCDHRELGAIGMFPLNDVTASSFGCRKLSLIFEAFFEIFLTEAVVRSCCFTKANT
jgi:hypothetical protein